MYLTGSDNPKGLISACATKVEDFQRTHYKVEQFGREAD